MAFLDRIGCSVHFMTFPIDAYSVKTLQKSMGPRVIFRYLSNRQAAKAQVRHRYSHAQSMEVEEVQGRKRRLTHLDTSAWAGRITLSGNHIVTEYEMSGETYSQKSGWINH